MDSAPIPVSSSAKSFPDCLQFQKTWRLYQTRILDRLSEYLSDRRVHLVAAPGSGKTVLGLEIIRRVGAPTLVLAPTITIRDQWVERLGCFLGDQQPILDWVSVDLKNPALLTITTYQALHALCGAADHETNVAEDEEDMTTETVETDGENGNVAVARRFPEVLSLAAFRTLVVDEAHHLRSEWWKTLTFAVDHLDRPTIVSLTATPPYDVTAFEWQRYEELCGPIDAEVSVPELVREGDLCAHQDYVYLSLPRPEELQVISGFRQGVESFVARLLADKDFVGAVASHPWIVTPGANIAALLEDPEYLSSMVIFLNAAGVSVPHQVLNAIGLSLKRIPGLELEWLEVLLTRCLYSDNQNFAATAEPVLKAIRRDLLQLGAIERRRVKLRSPADHLKLLTTSVTKLDSITEIIRLEAAAQNEGLRAVILTDFIRKSALPKSAVESCSFEDIGVVPIFETLRRARISGVQLGVLTGSLVIVPVSAVPSVREAAHNMGVHRDDLLLSAAQHDSEYRVVSLRGEYYQGSVRLLTSVFQAGALTVLVGTKALLGEGWDAPCINTLVLASFVGSYMLSNQMRGRSIRVDPERPNKVANIWHLVCVEPGAFGPGQDYELLTRRCGAFAGVSAAAPVIESGTNRLGIGNPPFSAADVEDRNRQTCARALYRQGLKRQWEAALEGGALKEMVNGIKSPDKSLPRGFVFSNTIMALLVEGVSLFFFVLAESLRGLGRVRPRDGEDSLRSITIVFALAALIGLPWVFLAIWRWIRHGTPERSIQQIGRAVLDSLVYAGEIDRRSGEFQVFADRHDQGSIFCWLSGGTGREQNTFLEAVRQILRPIDNPRYLLARPRFWRWFREDYFCVPEVLARKKEYAEFFAKRWRQAVGGIQLVFTRTPEGRVLLLRARGHSLAASFQKHSERISCWK